MNNQNPYGISFLTLKKSGICKKYIKLINYGPVYGPYNINKRLMTFRIISLSCLALLAQAFDLPSQVHLSYHGKGRRSVSWVTFTKTPVSKILTQGLFWYNFINKFFSKHCFWRIMVTLLVQSHQQSLSMVSSKYIHIPIQCWWRMLAKKHVGENHVCSSNTFTNIQLLDSGDVGKKNVAEKVCWRK